MPSLGTVASSRRPPPSPPVNMLNGMRSLFTGQDIAAPANVLGYWWAHTSNARLARTSDDTGGRSGKAMTLTVAVSTAANIAPTTGGQNASATWGMAPGETRTAFLSIKASKALTCQSTVQFFRADNTVITTVQAAWVVSTAWGDFRHVFGPAPAETVYMIWACNFPVMAVTDVVWFAQAGIFPGDVPSWVPVTADTWTRNLLDADRADMETGAMSGATVVCGWRNTLAATLPVRDSSAPRSGAWALRATAGPAAIARLDTNIPGTTTRYGLPVIPQTPYTFMFSARSPVAIPANTLLGQVVFFSDAGMANSAGNINIVTPTGEPMPANTWWDLMLPCRATNLAAIRVMLSFQASGLPTGTEVLFDRVGWFDGSIGSWTHPSTPGPP